MQCVQRGLLDFFTHLEYYSMNDWFTTEKIDSDTYIISEYRHPEETHCYLLLGAERALLIDTGLGIAISMTR